LGAARELLGGSWVPPEGLYASWEPLGKLLASSWEALGRLLEASKRHHGPKTGIVRIF